MPTLLPLRILIATILLGGSMAAAATSDTSGDDAQTQASKPATPAEVQAAITQAVRQDPGCWSDYDLDGDGKVSQIEIIACLAKRPAWMRDHLPDLFKRIDTNHDNEISFAELKAFADLADTKQFTLAERPRSVMGASQAAGGAQAGAGINVSGGGVEASAAFMHQQAYIAGYDVVGGQYQPVIGILGYGSVLNVGNVIITIVHEQH